MNEGGIKAYEILACCIWLPEDYSVSQKSSPLPKTFCDIFTYGEPV